MTQVELLRSLPDTARIWIYGFVSPLRESDQRLISERLSTFLEDWHSHRIVVCGDFAILHDRFVVIAGVSANGISGCSIDSSVENFKYLRDRYGLDGLNRELVFFRDDNGVIQAIDRQDFRTCRLSPDTPVFDTALETLGDLRDGRFERRLGDSWHARLLDLR